MCSHTFWAYIQICWIHIYGFVHLEVKTSGDKEDDNHNDNSSENFVTPLDRFRGGAGYLSVSDLTAQFWCEQQMEYNFLAPEPRPESEQMQLGKDIHLARGELSMLLNSKYYVVV